ncbi:MAG: MBL fold metallo-hydrolase [Nitrososphaerales archaeon]
MSQWRSFRKDSLRIEALVVPPLSNNVYIVYEDGTDDALVIDVALGARTILERLHELDLKAKLIVNTHGHADHTAEDGLLRRETGAKIAIQELDAYRLAVDEESELLGIMRMPLEPDIQLMGNQELSLGKNISLSVIHTPGHTEGSICLYDEKREQLFSGDTLFAGGYGRIDARGADATSMISSLKILIELPPRTEVYPGHGRFTTLGEEKWLNEIVQRNSL